MRQEILHQGPVQGLAPDHRGVVPRNHPTEAADRRPRASLQADGGRIQGLLRRHRAGQGQAVVAEIEVEEGEEDPRQRAAEHDRGDRQPDQAAGEAAGGQ